MITRLESSDPPRPELSTVANRAKRSFMVLGMLSATRRSYKKGSQENSSPSAGDCRCSRRHPAPFPIERFVLTRFGSAAVRSGRSCSHRSLLVSLLPTVDGAATRVSSKLTSLNGLQSWQPWLWFARTQNAMFFGPGIAVIASGAACQFESAQNRVKHRSDLVS